jgi:cytochrome P450
MRTYSPHNILFPEGIMFAYTLSDRRYFRNVDRFRDFIQQLIDERRQSQDADKRSDLLSILIASEFFRDNNDGMIIDEIFTFFLAGMKTIQASTTNLIYYLTKHPEYKQKLLKEILLPLE